MVLINIFYKILIKQRDAKALKERVNAIRDEMKAAQKERNTDKTGELMKEFLSNQNKLMRMTLKPMLVSFIIFILILPLINGMFGDVSVPAADGAGNVTLGGATYVTTKTGANLTASDARSGASVFACELPCTQTLDETTWKINQREDKVVFARVITHLPVPLPYFGSMLGWLGWYFLCSIPLALIVRRLLKIYV